MNYTRDCLYLGSQSSSRLQLLRDAGYSVIVLPQNADERAIQFDGDCSAYVQAIAREKMASLLLPDSHDTTVFVITADTMVYIPATHELFGKPHDKQDAMRMFAVMYEHMAQVVTGTCLRVYKKNVVLHEQLFTVSADIAFKIYPDDRERYLQQLPQALYCCGAGIVENFGANFVERVSGSYSAIVGLPLYEIRSFLRLYNFNF